MPKLLTEAELKTAVGENNSFILHADVRSVEGIKVDLHLGDSVLKAQYGQPISIKSRAESERNALQIDPGEVVFVLTKEELNLDGSLMATLSPKRSLAHSGIIVLGGFAVDPGYRGVLWLGLYNISSTPYILLEGKKLISALFYKLDEGERQGIGSLSTLDEPVRQFPEQLIELISKYRPVELKGLQDLLEETRKDLSNLRHEMTDDRTWREDFKRSLDTHNQQIADLLRGLEAETIARQTGEGLVRQELSAITSMFHGLRNWRTASLAVGALLLGAILTWGIPKIFDHPAVPPPPYPYYAYPYGGVPAQPPPSLAPTNIVPPPLAKK